MIDKTIYIKHTFSHIPYFQNVMNYGMGLNIFRLFCAINQAHIFLPKSKLFFALPLYILKKPKHADLVSENTCGMKNWFGTKIMYYEFMIYTED